MVSLGHNELILSFCRHSYPTHHVRWRPPVVSTVPTVTYLPPHADTPGWSHGAHCTSLDAARTTPQVGTTHAQLPLIICRAPLRITKGDELFALRQLAMGVSADVPALYFVRSSVGITLCKTGPSRFLCFMRKDFNYLMVDSLHNLPDLHSTLQHTTKLHTTLWFDGVLQGSVRHLCG